MSTRTDPRPHVERTDIVTPTTPADPSLRSGSFNPPRRRWPGFVITGVMAAGLTALAVSSFYDKRSVGEKLDATVQATQQKVQDGVDDMRLSASAAARDGAQASERAAAAFNDAGITAAVKTALAADPRLSAVKIEVNTDSGVVSLQGPAPDERSRERAEVLAAAPRGVLRVDNRLVVSPEPATHTR
jgi:osmotically-inducible protein OsmY